MEKVVAAVKTAAMIVEMVAVVYDAVHLDTAYFV
jgi:hypothetical protein